MAATKLTRNKLQRARLIAYWVAQAQGHCSECGKPLVNGKVSSVDDLTVEHLSGTYDHVKRRERVKGKGVRLMHARCHKSMTMHQNKVWAHRRNLNT